jgi:hypothetical protein
MEVMIMINATLKDITLQILELPQRSRALLADVILDSLDEQPENSNDRAWLKIAYKRDGEISAGKVKCKSHDEIMNSVRMKLKCMK